MQTKKLFIYILTFSILCFSSIDTFAQKKAKSPVKSPVTIEEFLTDGIKTMNGLTTVYQKDGKFYLNIDESILDKDILMVTRISKSASGIRTKFNGYAGDPINDGVFKFILGENNDIYMKAVNTSDYISEGSELKDCFERSNLMPITEIFKIVAQSSDKKNNIIDVTDLFNSDNGTFFFTKRGKKPYGLGSMEKDKSFIKSIHTYPINTEVKVLKTYLRSDGESSATFELNVSFVKLPEVPMTPRYSDSRIGYFTANYKDYGKNHQGVDKVRLITRWRLEPKPEDMDKYINGELVEPIKPIIFYIDPTTPKKWVPYLIQGVNDWEAEFRKAGFKNAIYAKEAPSPEEDPTWSFEDARNSTLMYMPSETANAMGPHTHDPRTGEIIESHIHWYHNVMQLLRNWYFIQCSPSDKGARNMIFDDELMGQLIRFVSSHEVGHTLGLRHNFAGTALYSVEQLRDPKFLKENGHTTSIMDYSRFNYVAQPEDNIPRELLFPKIGPYDGWAIEWGYRLFPEYNNPDKELGKLNEWVIEKTKDKRYYFGSESSPADPRAQAEDLGSNQMETNELGIKNLKYVVNHLVEWTYTPNKEYENLKEMHGQVLSQYKRYLGHITTWIGGVYETPKKVEQDGGIFTVVEKNKQEEAIKFLERNVFIAPTWIVPTDIMNKLVSRPDFTMESIYKKVFYDIMTKKTMLNLYEAEIELGNKAYTINDLFNDLNKSVIMHKPTITENPIYIRMMQKVYINSICDLFSGASVMSRGGGAAKDNSDITSILFYQLNNISELMSKQPAKTMEEKAHRLYVQEMISTTLKDGANAAKKKK